jgi:hypothetical protein
MKRLPLRAEVSAVIPTRQYADAGRRPPRGVRRHNRRVLAEARRWYHAPAVVYTEPAKPTKLANISALSYATRPRNDRGDCPYCGAMGAQPQVRCILRHAGAVVTCSNCTRCKGYFAPFALKKVGAPANGPVFENLLPSLMRSYHDCPVDGCGLTDVTHYVMVRDSSGGQVRAARCTNGHLFQPGTGATSPPPELWTGE